MRLPAALLALALQGGAALAQQQVETLWNCRDKDGRTILTNQQSDTVGKECRVVHQQRVTVVPGAKPGAKAPSPAGFPKESTADRAASRDKQRQTLERELAQEQDMLTDARRKLAEQEAVRSGGERNHAKALERLKPYQDAVEVHSKNVEALKRELANLSR
jgi:transcription initiation factor TFIIIB Brf1 subunit/transcription initiation factor TFIIB